VVVHNALINSLLTAPPTGTHLAARSECVARRVCAADGSRFVGVSESLIRQVIETHRRLPHRYLVLGGVCDWAEVGRRCSSTFPDIGCPVAVVQTAHSGARPAKVEQSTTNAIEYGAISIDGVVQNGEGT
jgi:hypothetical protein